MGWTNSHLHAFRMDGALYGMQFDDCPEDELDEAKFAVADVVGLNDRFIYEYDFGDSWDHEVVVGAREQGPPGAQVRGLPRRGKRLPSRGLRRDERL